MEKKEGKNMHFETLHGRKRKKYIIVGAIVLLIVGSVLILKPTKAKYKNEQHINIVNGTIYYTTPDLSIASIKLQKTSGSTEESNYETTSTVPTTGYTLNTTKSYCEVNGVTDATIPITYENGEVTIGVNKNGTKCYIYLDIYNPTAEDVLAMLGKTSNGVKTSFSGTATTNEGIWSAPDGMYGGTSYYYRGAVNNNWVKFAGIYWRIIRINGDGSIRMIYSGTTAPTSSQAVKMTGTGTELNNMEYCFGTLACAYDNNAYVGYYYTIGNAHGTGTPSYAAKQVNDWYNNNFESGKIYYELGQKYIDIDGLFCSDRTAYTSSSGFQIGGGTGKTDTYYGAYIRFYKNSNYVSPANPTLSCSGNEGDLMTYAGASSGNKAMASPAGLITADEVIFAGGFMGTTNDTYYLYTGRYYWTMTPYNYDYYNSYGARVFNVTTVSGLGVDPEVKNKNGIRPVINLKNTTIFTGNGTYSSPYEVV